MSAAATGALAPAAGPELAAGVTPAGALILLLVSGHLLGDFAFQTRRMVDGKRRTTVLLGHALVVAAVHLVVLAPFFGSAVLAAVVGIGALHAVIDRFKTRGGGAGSGPVAVFLLDQAAHLAVLLVAFALLRQLAWPLAPRLPANWLHGWTLTAVVAAAFAFNWTGGAALVSAVLGALSPGLEEAEERSSGVRGSGRTIGVLERTITLILILLGQWAAIVLLLAAKSIARFEELKKRRFAEYYLVGTLSSLLVAILTGLALSAVLFGGVP